MRGRDIGIFCSVCLGATLGIVTLLFGHAALTVQALARAQKPQSMTESPPVDLGMPYGKQSMTDLVGNYLEHPQAAGATDTPAVPPGQGLSC